MTFKSDKQRKAFFASINNPSNQSIHPTIIKQPTLKTLNIKSNRLPVQFSVIVPSTTSEDKQISNSAFRKRIDSEKKFFSKTFGGDTSIKSVGSFVLAKKNKKDILIKEKTTIVESSTTPAEYRRNKKLLERHIKVIQKKWKQNSIFYKIEGEGFVYPRQSFIPHHKSKNKILVS